MWLLSCFRSYDESENKTVATVAVATVETLFLGTKSSENVGCFIQVFEKKPSLNNITARLIQDGVPVVSKCASHIINLLTASEVGPNKA